MIYQPRNAPVPNFSMDRGGQVEDNDVLAHFLRQKGIQQSPLWHHAGASAYNLSDADLVEYQLLTRSDIADSVQADSQKTLS